MQKKQNHLHMRMFYSWFDDKLAVFRHFQPWVITFLCFHNIRNVKRNFFLSCCLTYKSLNNLAPYYLSDLFSFVSEYHTISTRNATSNTPQQPRCNNSLYKSSLSVNGSRLWNKLPLEIRNKKTFSAFKYNLKLYMANNQTLTQL